MTDPEPMVHGTLMAGFAQACINLNIVACPGAAELLADLDVGRWYALRRWCGGEVWRVLRPHFRGGSNVRARFFAARFRGRLREAWRIARAFARMSRWKYRFGERQTLRAVDFPEACVGWPYSGLTAAPPAGRSGDEPDPWNDLGIPPDPPPRPADP